MIHAAEPLAAPQVGDYVTIVASPGALTWRVLEIHDKATANGPLYTLESGQTGRRRYELGENLIPFPHNEPRRLAE